MLNPESFTMKHGDTPIVRWGLFNKDGSPVDLTDAEVVIRWRRSKDAVVEKTLDVTIPVTDGQVSFQFDGTLIPGPYAYEIRADRDGVILTAPTIGQGTFTVVGNIGAPA